MEDFSRYNGEGTELRKAQHRLVEMLLVIDEVCKKNDIHYWIDFGTLLGAVRHKGFVPWDDDIDVCICRNELKKLRKALLANLPEYMFMLDESVYPQAYFRGYTRVLDKKSHLVRKVLPANNIFEKFNNGLCIDVFISEHGSAQWRKRIDFIYGRCYRRIFHAVKSTFFQRIVAYALYPFSLFCISMFRLVNRVFPTQKRTYSFGTIFSKQHRDNEIFPLKTIEFEGYVFPCPNNTDKYLRNLYGDYMKIPDEAHRDVHTFHINIDE